MKRYIILPILSFIAAFTILVGAGAVLFPETASDHMANARMRVTHVYTISNDHLAQIWDGTKAGVANGFDAGQAYMTHAWTGGLNNVAGGWHAAKEKSSTLYEDAVKRQQAWLDNIQMSVMQIAEEARGQYDGMVILAKNSLGSYYTRAFIAEDKPNAIQEPVEVVSLRDVNELASITPGAGNNDGDVIDATPPRIEYEYEPDEDEIESEAVLVPREKTVISSSRDGQIKSIHFANGDEFKKGDILLEYECKDIRAELDAAGFEQKLARQKLLTTSRLYDLSIASEIDKEQASVDKQIASAKRTVAQSKLDSCIIRAQFDGRVVERLANPSEYTRTDRVLMEVASSGTLDAEFLMPSIWLRYINIDAPITIFIEETGKDYTGEISRIYGEVDPVSQSIQVRATLDDYTGPLLPGMSGRVSLSVSNIRDAGIRGFLDTAGQ